MVLGRNPEDKNFVEDKNFSTRFWVLLSVFVSIFLYVFFTAFYVSFFPDESSNYLAIWNCVNFSSVFVELSSALRILRTGFLLMD